MHGVVFRIRQHPLLRGYLEDYWPCAGGLSTVNAIGTQLHQNHPVVNEGVTRDGTSEPVSQDQILSHERGPGDRENSFFMLS